MKTGETPDEIRRGNWLVIDRVSPHGPGVGVRAFGLSASIINWYGRNPIALTAWSHCARGSRLRSEIHALKKGSHEILVSGQFDVLDPIFNLFRPIA